MTVTKLCLTWDKVSYPLTLKDLRARLGGLVFTRVVPGLLQMTLEELEQRGQGDLVATVMDE
jgi:hypothetical protein